MMRIVFVLLIVVILGLEAYNIGSYILLARAVFFIALTVYYKRSRFYNAHIFVFMFLFTLAESFASLMIFYDIMPSVGLAIFYISNTIYIASYLVLFRYILKYLRVNFVLKNFIFSTIVLIILGVYIAYSTIELGVLSQEDQVLNFYDHLYLVVYIVIVITVLITVLLSFISKPANSFLSFFIGILCVAFYEIITIGSFYNGDNLIINLSALALLLSGFCIIALNRNSFKVIENE